MELIFDNLIWILLAGSILFVVFYKLIVGDVNALTGKFRTTEFLDVGQDQLSEAILQAMRKAGFTSVRHEEGTNRFAANTKVSFYSWTEIIEVTTKEEGNQQKITFSSMCYMPVQLVDWGKNKLNFKRFKKALNQEMSIQE